MCQKSKNIKMEFIYSEIEYDKLTNYGQIFEKQQEYDALFQNLHKM